MSSRTEHTKQWYFTVGVTMIYQYIAPDGIVHTDVTTAYLEGQGFEPQDIARIQAESATANINYQELERDWRNSELRRTDCLLLPDSTYNGNLVIGSVFETEILLYRSSLRGYDLKEVNRPNRPNWFTK